MQNFDHDHRHSSSIQSGNRRCTDAKQFRDQVADHWRRLVDDSSLVTTPIWKKSSMHPMSHKRNSTSAHVKDLNYISRLRGQYNSLPPVSRSTTSTLLPPMRQKLLAMPGGLESIYPKTPFFCNEQKKYRTIEYCNRFHRAFCNVPFLLDPISRIDG